MQIKQYQVDAFASRPFEGNPAAVCVLERWLADDVLQAIAEENNLSETAFFVPCDTGFELRWFTPTTEVDLCGHATLATAHVIFDQLGYSQPAIHFHTRSGELKVQKHANMLQMDFPALLPLPCEIPDALVQGLGDRPAQLLRSDDYLAVFDSEQHIRALQPDFARLGQLDLRGVIVTAPGKDVDFVSRFFAPGLGVPEDPVTGSAHCTLAPYWAGRLGKTTLQARQLSPRGGNLACELHGERVLISGSAVTFMHGVIEIDPLQVRG
jgi:predicted PhzF superfamily epimerase YddE/YHI9